jgi:hypothetical protein
MVSHYTEIYQPLEGAIVVGLQAGQKVGTPE